MASSAGSTLKSSTSQKLAKASNKFSFELYRKLCAKPRNVFYSPLSLSTALAMLYHGARGISKAQMRDVLNYDSENLADEEIQEIFKNFLETASDSSDYTLDIANSILIAKNFTVNSEYVKILKNYYLAEAKNVDYASAAEQVKTEINSWVANKTRNKIKNLLNEISRQTVLILLNAVYFKGTWRKQFDAKATVPGTFYNHGLESSAKSVPMMNLRNEHFRYLDMKDLDLQALEMPYEGNCSMWILLPNKLNGLIELERQLTTDVFSEIIANCTNVNMNVIIIPKFKLEFKIDLVDHINEMGIPSLFCNNADLKGINKEAMLCVSQIIHKAQIEVSEEGCEASAATAIVIGRSMPLRSRKFTADHPFIFVITDNNSGFILFVGRVEAF